MIEKIIIVLLIIALGAIITQFNEKTEEIKELNRDVIRYSEDSKKLMQKLKALNKEIEEKKRTIEIIKASRAW